MVVQPGREASKRSRLLEVELVKFGVIVKAFRQPGYHQSDQGTGGAPIHTFTPQVSPSAM